jgi:hypothetical protein
MRKWARRRWWRPPLTARLLEGRLFGRSPSDAARIVLWLAIASVTASMVVGASIGALLGQEHVWWVGGGVGGIVALAVLPVLWVFACACWAEGRADSPSELVRARRRLQHASAWAEVDGWLEHQLATASHDDPPFDPFPREYVDERFDGPGRRGQVGSYASFLVQIFLASGKLAAARAELDDIRCSLPRASPRARARLRHLSGLLARAEKDLTAADRAHRAALTGQLAGGHWSDLAASLEALAGLALARGDAESCALLAGAAESLRVRLGATTRQAFEDQCLQRDLVNARAVLHDEFELRYRQGAALDADEAVALVLSRGG